MNAKKLAAEKAVTYVKDGMTVGLGTGTTALFAIEALGKMVKDGLSVKAVASSIRSEVLAKNAGIQLISFSEVKKIDLYIDGADEADGDWNLIKGGGGALLREKLLAFNSEEFIVIVDQSKLVEQLGAFPLAVEIVPFAFELTLKHLENSGCTPVIRMANGAHYITDNGNLIADCAFNKISDVDQLNLWINCIPGVVENGLFPQSLVAQIIVGYDNGEVNLVERK
ncbi:MAG: ribose-5-phosphate isomerase RpiA [Flavisolibacter sp.]